MKTMKLCLSPTIAAAQAAIVAGVLGVGALLGLVQTGCQATPAQDALTAERILNAPCELASEQPEPTYVVFLCTALAVAESQVNTDAGDGGITIAGVPVRKTFKVRIPRAALPAASVSATPAVSGAPAAPLASSSSTSVTTKTAASAAPAKVK